MRAAMLVALVPVLGAGYASRIMAVDDHANVVSGHEVVIDVLANDGVLGPRRSLHWPVCKRTSTPSGCTRWR